MSGAQPAGLPAREADTAAASAVKALQAEGRHQEARDRYAELVARHQRRGSRIAFHYLRDAAEADEAVQDALVKAYTHLGSFREELPFEVWFTRILINGCLDRIKARTRRERWIAPMPDANGAERDFTERVALHGSREAIVRGEEFRAVLARTFGARSVRSALFDVRREGDRILFEGRGFGHGVGLCQAGAISRLRAGATSAAVLQRYFPGTRLARLK